MVHVEHEMDCLKGFSKTGALRVFVSCESGEYCVGFGTVFLSV